MMPSGENWRIVPLNVISKIFDEDNKRSEAGQAADERKPWTNLVAQFFREKCSVPGWRQTIPDLEATPNHELVDGQLVRFRGMVQDMFDPEYYYSKYKIKDLSTGCTRIATGRYRDFADNGPREEILYDTAVAEQRQMYYCVSVPGLTPWARFAYKKDSPSTPTPTPSVSDSVRMKRSADDEPENCDSSSLEARVEETMEVEEDASAAKKARNDEKSLSAGKLQRPQEGGLTSLNFPIPGAEGQAAIVKLYEVEEDEFSLNRIFEFVGIVCLNPLLARVPLEGCDVLNQFEEKELVAKNPPTSLVPRIHVVTHFKLAHSNPLLPLQVSLANKSAIREQSASCRKELHAKFTTMLLGDELAADYLISHLISHVYHRLDCFCLGKFSLNLFNVPLQNNYVKRMCTLIQLMLTKSHYLPLTTDNLNKLTYVPKKDYHANRLVSGLLQLSYHTQLMLDETAMRNGQLTADGVRNLTAIGTLISWQRAEYNFNYHNVEIAMDVPCLVLSEGRSMLPNDVDVMMKPKTTPTPSVIENGLSAFNSELGSDFLDRMRRYLTVVGLIQDYNLTDDLQKEVQEDFVAERQARRQQQQRNGNNDDQDGRVPQMTTDDLHSHLVLARFVGISKGESTLTRDTWEKTKNMEKQRKQRVAHLPPPRRAAFAPHN